MRLARMLGVAGIVSALAQVSHAAPKRERPAKGVFLHDGFHLDGEIGAGVLLLTSDHTVSNGFQQRIDSSARGLAIAPSFSLGGTLRGTGIVLAGAFSYVRAVDPVIETLGQRFRISGLELTMTTISMLVRYYPEPTEGFNFGGSFGGGSVELTGESFDGAYYGGDGESPAGLLGALEAGHGLWLAPQWSIGARARFTAAYLGLGGGESSTIVYLPTLSVALAWH